MRLGLLALALLFNIESRAEVPGNFNYQGKLSDSSGNSLSGAFQFKMQIYDPTATCLLYEEVQAPVLIDSTSLFSLSIGSVEGSAKRGLSDPGLAMEKVFSNSDGAIRNAGSSNCVSGYAPISGDIRRMKVTITNSSTGEVSVLSPLQEVSMSPYSLVASRSSNSNKLGGKASTEFIQTEGASVTQSNVKSLTDKVTEILAMVSANAANKFQSLVNDYQGAGRITVATNPTVNTDAVNQSYVDSKIAGKTAPSFASGTNKFLKYNGTVWIFESPTVGGSISQTDITDALGYTPQQQNSELTGIGSMTSLGLVQRSAAGSYIGIGTTAPINITSNSLGISVGDGLKLNAGSLVPDFGGAAGKVVEGNDARLPSSTCGAGNVSRWDGSAWVCDAAPSSSVNSISVRNSDANILVSEQVILSGATPLSANITLTLPSAVGNIGKQYSFKKVDSSNYSVSIVGSSSQTVDGMSSVVLQSQYQYLTVVSDGANWQILNTTSVAKLCLKTVKTILNTANPYPSNIVVSYLMVGGGGGGGGWPNGPWAGSSGGGGGSTAVLAGGSVVAIANGGNGAQSNTTGSAGLSASGTFTLNAGASLEVVVGGGGGGGGFGSGTGGGGGSGYYGGGGGSGPGGTSAAPGGGGGSSTGGTSYGTAAGYKFGGDAPVSGCCQRGFGAIAGTGGAVTGGGGGGGGGGFGAGGGRGDIGGSNGDSATSGAVGANSFTITSFSLPSGAGAGGIANTSSTASAGAGGIALLSYVSPTGTCDL
jgi:hypothetical protein